LKGQIKGTARGQVEARLLDLSLSGALLHLIFSITGLPVATALLVAMMVYYQIGPSAALLFFPIVFLVQLIFTIGLALFLSALTVHFRDLKDLLGNVVQLWFFATPIIYPMTQAPVNMRQWLNLNPMTHIMRSYQQVLFFEGPLGHQKALLGVGVLSIGLFLAGYFVFDRLRDSFAEEV